MSKKGQIMETKKWKNRNFWEALLHSLEGIKYAFHTERNLKIQLLIAVLVIIVGTILKLTQTQWLILCLNIGMVLFAEMMNTAIEIVLDLYTEKYDEKIKRAKDMASGAVLIIAIISAISGCILFLPKMLN